LESSVIISHIGNNISSRAYTDPLRVLKGARQMLDLYVCMCVFYVHIEAVQVERALERVPSKPLAEAINLVLILQTLANRWEYTPTYLTLHHYSCTTLEN
jgi:hypothetical protein